MAFIYFTSFLSAGSNNLFFKILLNFCSCTFIFSIEWHTNSHNGSNYLYDTFNAMGQSCTHQCSKRIQNPFNCIPSRYPGYLAGMVLNRQNLSMAVMVYSRMGDRRTVSLPRCICFQKIKEQLKSNTHESATKKFQTRRNRS